MTLLFLTVLKPTKLSRSHRLCPPQNKSDNDGGCGRGRLASQGAMGWGVPRFRRESRRVRVCIHSYNPIWIVSEK